MALNGQEIQRFPECLHDGNVKTMDLKLPLGVKKSKADDYLALVGCTKSLVHNRREVVHCCATCNHQIITVYPCS